jgi:hypothetical protein
MSMTPQINEPRAPLRTLFDEPPSYCSKIAATAEDAMQECDCTCRSFAGDAFECEIDGHTVGEKNLKTHDPTTQNRNYKISNWTEHQQVQSKLL